MGQAESAPTIARPLMENRRFESWEIQLISWVRSSWAFWFRLQPPINAAMARTLGSSVLGGPLLDCHQPGPGALHLACLGPGRRRSDPDPGASLVGLYRRHRGGHLCGGQHRFGARAGRGALLRLRGGRATALCRGGRSYGGLWGGSPKPINLTKLAGLALVDRWAPSWSRAAIAEGAPTKASSCARAICSWTRKAERPTRKLPEPAVLGLFYFE